LTNNRSCGSNLACTPPPQFERWSHVVAIAHNHLVLASPLVEPVLRPWESKQRPASLQQVRRGLNKLLPELGTPARPPKPRSISERQVRWREGPQEDAFFGGLQKAQIASTCTILTVLSAVYFEIFLFHRTRFGVLVASFSLNVNSLS
jgi:hypothetical protein